ncbi:hypothetical protein BH09PLA1_BH09PLA1_07080 [soil metagenome]
MRARHGISIIYASILMVVMAGFASFAVDLGRVQVAKTELQNAADAAARFGAAGLAISGTQARTNAKAAALENSSDGTVVTLTDADIEFGKWKNNSFSSTSINASGNNAIRVTARRAQSRNTGIPLLFAGVIGQSALDVKAVSTSFYNAPSNYDLNVPASSDLWLAGAPNGTLDNTNLYNSSVRRDRAGPYTDPSGVFHPQGESPSQLTGLPLVPGQSLSFDTIAGTGAHGSGQTVVGPDGNLAKITPAWAGAHFGMSNLTSPIDAVVAVFLDDSNPAGQTPPADLDFTTQAARDYTSISPLVRQTFFIGDGRTSTGTVQQIVVPGGATRLFIGKMDGTEWNNNIGSSTVTISYTPSIQLVK